MSSCLFGCQRMPLKMSLLSHLSPTNSRSSVLRLRSLSWSSVQSSRKSLSRLVENMDDRSGKPLLELDGSVEVGWGWLWGREEEVVGRDAGLERVEGRVGSEDRDDGAGRLWFIEDIEMLEDEGNEILVVKEVR